MDPEQEIMEPVAMVIPVDMSLYGYGSYQGGFSCRKLKTGVRRPFRAYCVYECTGKLPVAHSEETVFYGRAGKGRTA